LEHFQLICPYLEFAKSLGPQAALTAQKAALESRAANSRPPLPSMPPNLAEVYRTKVTGVLERPRDLVLVISSNDLRCAH
jgi:hypothetical protein